MLIIGSLFVLIALAFVIAYLVQKRKYGAIRATPTFTVEQLQSLSDDLARRGDAGSLRFITEVKGRVGCDQPLVSELTETECVYYSMKVEWEYNEIFYEESGDERIEHKREGEETLAERNETVPFWIEDATGRIVIDPEGAELIPKQTLSRTEDDEGLPDEEIRMGRFAMEAPWKTSEEERRPKEYRFEEEAIPVDQEVYVLGEAVDSDGVLRVQNPTRRGRFIISTRREESLLREGRLTMIGLVLGAIVFGFVGLAMIVLDLTKQASSF
jgi:hypothetical protein